MRWLFLIFLSVINREGPSQSAQNKDSSHQAFVYETVSIRPCESQLRQVQQTENAFRANCAGLWTLMYYAFPDINMPNQIAGIPNWARSDAFAIEAKMDDKTVESMRQISDAQRVDERKAMLQAILKDRFKLQYHYEFRESASYDLVIAKHGAKLKPSGTSEGAGIATMRTGLITVRGRSLRSLAEVLTHVVGRQVVDKTGLSGNYDISLAYRPDEQAEVENNAASLFTALQEQLGLKLVRSDSRLTIIAIDRVEQPTPN